MSHTALMVRAPLLRGAVALGLVLGMVAVSQAQTAIVRVEEDWELQVGEPDPNLEAPQITCVITPNANMEGLYAAFTLNHQAAPEFLAGGYQLRFWNGDVPLTAASSDGRKLLATAGESLHWTQAMSVTEGILACEVRNGSSVTWGPFGEHGALKVAMPTALSDLSGYRPETSVANSGVGYAGNRVSELSIARVRYYLSDGRIVEDTQRRVVHPSAQHE